MTRIIIFAKAPLAGFAKTRLIPVLGPEGAAKLAQQMLRHAMASAVDAAIGPVELCVTPEFTAPAWLGVDITQGIEVSTQDDGDLGTRLARAAQRALEQSGSVLLIGTDCAEMSASLLRKAATTLKCNDAVIYPVADGGYALLGLARFHPSLFENLAWSTDNVASKTIERIGQLGWRLEVGVSLHDIDEPDDLRHAPENWLQA
ncbi:MAG TPA: TIGR04282 family arsenosugar biosynthesis glycosyltransferase [Gallionella sp.]|jgi:rSAM/selenodomain-associated transferase 1|nr:TIGR04282 family arsenosugar biosynthesis glycosyltransferase [Gallionella sp.]